MRDGHFEPWSAPIVDHAAQMAIQDGGTHICDLPPGDFVPFRTLFYITALGETGRRNLTDGLRKVIKEAFARLDYTAACSKTCNFDSGAPEDPSTAQHQMCVLCDPEDANVIGVFLHKWITELHQKKGKGQGGRNGRSDYISITRFNSAPHPFAPVYIARNKTVGGGGLVTEFPPHGQQQ